MQKNALKPQLTILFLMFNLLMQLCSINISHAADNGSVATNNVKSYLNAIKAIAVEFKQTDTRGAAIAHGMFIINKPLKFRCNYYEPFPLLIVGNKNYVGIYDFEMENFSRIKSEENIFNFLLLDNMELQNQFQILAEKKVGSSYIVELFHTDSGREYSISFNKNSKQIERLQIFEEANEIDIKFGKVFNIKEIDDNLFILQDPDIFGKPERLNKIQLEKKYKLILD